MALIEHSRRATPERGRTALLAAGDGLTFLLFAALGRSSHGEGLALLNIVEVAAPFALGWALVAPFVGAYNAEVVALPRATLPRTALAWALALPVGLLLRGLATQKVPPLSFAVTTFIILGLLLLGWRGLFAWRASRKEA